MQRRILHLHEPGHGYTLRALGRQLGDGARLRLVPRSHRWLLPDDRPPVVRVDRRSAVRRAAGLVGRDLRAAVGRGLTFTGLSSGDVVLFTDIERLSTVRCEQLDDARRSLGPEITALNDPLRSLRRYALLRRLHEAGVNSANAYRLSECRSPQRWPVFLRAEDDHSGASSPLLSNQAELEGARAGLRASGGHPDRHLFVEHVPIATVDGLVPKHAAFRVGPRIIPRHVLFSRHWVVKHTETAHLTQRHHDLERAYLASNPHEAELRRIFDLAGISYGRIDYAEHEGGLEVFEINTNPNVRLAPLDVDDPRHDVHRRFLDRLQGAFEDLPAGWSPSVHEPPVHGALEGHRRSLGPLEQAHR